ncbi:MAG: aminotransferase class V-fold PLP-dependent enzyme [Candidatus Eisenbacteria bacterium]|uniref:Aminotransferase class V-fold PLP-dependent enzyme n=1 Tax=Eiseniibacteriota bacterium TaxID=2212470 RepID=A0A849SM95_UNCEI|nr:aminotransferase class V-fold PLP-dependent enzyme [Candidatus Eisenbacteria bacterium]
MTQDSNAADSTSPLDPPADRVAHWGHATVDAMSRYVATLRERPVHQPTTAARIRERLDSALPQGPADFDEVLRTFHEVMVPMSRHSGHPRMFGYVQSPGTPVAALADFIASTLNSNVTAWRSAPAAAEIERLSIDWIRQILGVESGAAGLFVSGGSMANLTALATARRAKASTDVARAGARSEPRAMRLYASAETHHSIAKAAALLGIGADHVRLIEVDERSRVRVDELIDRIEEDVREGYLPFCVVANAGTVATGAIDPLETLAEVARRFGLWLHVDASYGGFAALAPSVRQRFVGLREADSIALDPHKWLYLPIDCGCVLFRDPSTARATFAHDAEYTRVMERDPDQTFAFWDYGPELSRRFRALKVWALLRCVGVRALGEAIEANIDCARHFERLVEASEDFEMLAPVELSIFCFRYVPAAMRMALDRSDAVERARLDRELDALNERLLVALQRDGSSYLSNAGLGGRFSLRGCVLNYRTTRRDMEILLADLRRVASGIRREAPDSC